MVLSHAALATLALYLSTTSAHMIMTNPAPFVHVAGQGDQATLNAPMNPPNAGLPSNFPCKGATVPNRENPPISAGSEFPVTIDGSAVHGGGVCQFSVNYDDTPSADPSRWKVIHTIIGGCPAAAVGNLAETGVTNEFGSPTGNQCGDSTSTECVRSFNIPFPAELPNGRANFAWTWFNKVGNREMYMDCAPITIEGGSDDTAFVDALPQIYVANTEGVNTCRTQEGILTLPAGHIGQSVVNNEPATTPEGTGECGFQGGASSAPSAPSTPVTAAPEGDDAPAPAPAAPAAGGCSGSTVTIASGNTCITIAEANGVTVDAFLAANPSIDAACSNLQLDAQVCVPAAGAKKRTIAHPHARRFTAAL